MSVAAKIARYGFFGENNKSRQNPTLSDRISGKAGDWGSSSFYDQSTIRGVVIMDCDTNETIGGWGEHNEVEWVEHTSAPAMPYTMNRQHLYGILPQNLLTSDFLSYIDGEKVVAIVFIDEKPKD